MKGGVKKQCESSGGRLVARVTVAKIETDGRTARVFLSDGNGLHGLVHVDTHAEASGLSKFAIEGYIIGVSEMDKRGYN